MLSYRYLALVVLLSVSRSGSSELLRGASRMQEDGPTSGKSKRMNTLGELSSSFNSIKAFIDKADTSDETDVVRLEEVASRIGDFEPAFKELESEMVDDGADSEEWAEFGTALSGYSELVSAIGVKFEARDVESVDEEENASQIDLLSALMSAEDKLETVEDKSDLGDIVDTLLFVAEETRKMEGGEVKDKFEETINIMMDQVENKKNSFESEKHVVTKEERMDVLSKIDSSFDSVSKFLINAGADEVSRIEEIVTGIKSMNRVFDQLENEMMEEKVDEESWKAFGSTKGKYLEIVDLLSYKVGEVNALKNEEETGNENDELISALEFARDNLESAEDKKDLEEIEEILLFVAEKTQKMESGETKDTFVQALSIMTEKVENMDSEFESEDPVEFEEETGNENEELLSTLEFVRKSIENAEDKSDLEVIENTLLFVVEETQKMKSGEIKDKFVQALSIMTEKVESMDNEFSSNPVAVEPENTAVTKEERMDVLSKINSSFDAMSAFVNDAGVNEGSRLVEIFETTGKMASVFTQFKDEMIKEKADEETWNAFSFTLDKYSALVDVLASQLQIEEESEEVDELEADMEASEALLDGEDI